MRLIPCKSCGAPLETNKCRYCGAYHHADAVPTHFGHPVKMIDKHYGYAIVNPQWVCKLVIE